MNHIRVLLADDHAVLRAGLRSLLEAESDMSVVAESSDGDECLKEARVHRPDVILLDINMPNCDGLECLRHLRAQIPESRVLILTMHDDVGYLKEVISSGGAGFVLKQAASEELLSAIRTVHEGGIFLHPRHAAQLISNDSQLPPASENAAQFATLSSREAEVFRLVALGYRNSEIAESLFLSVRTVETYKARVMQKLNLDTRSALVRFALDIGALGSDPS